MTDADAIFPAINSVHKLNRVPDFIYSTRLLSQMDAARILSILPNFFVITKLGMIVHALWQLVLNK